LDGSDPLRNYQTIRNELAQYSPKLAERPELLVATKMDITGAEEARQRLEVELNREVPGISAVTGRGIPQLLHRIAESLAEFREPPKAAEETVRAGGPAQEAPAAPDLPPSVPVTDPVTGV